MERWCAANNLTLDTIIRPGDEDSKTMENCLAIIEELGKKNPLRRSEPVLAVGGGVLTDVAGFACALWRRGIPWCRIPTTLLGESRTQKWIPAAVLLHLLLFLFF